MCSDKSLLQCIRHLQFMRASPLPFSQRGHEASHHTALLQLFTRKAARVLYANQRLQRWCFDVELIYLAQRLRIPIVEASVNWTEIAGEALWDPPLSGPFVTPVALGSVGDFGTLPWKSAA